MHICLIKIRPGIIELQDRAMFKITSVKDNSQTQINFACNAADYLARRMELNQKNLDHAAEIFTLRSTFRQQCDDCGFPTIGRFFIAIDRSLSH